MTSAAAAAVEWFTFSTDAAIGEMEIRYGDGSVDRSEEVEGGTMTTRRLRVMHWSIGAVCTAIGVLAIVVAVRSPLDSPATTSPTRLTQKHADASERSIPPLATFDQLFSLRLQQPLFETTPDSPTPRTESPPSRLHLTGTIVEPGRSVALFQTDSGQIEQRRVGERLEGAELLRVARDHVEVMHAGQVVRLKVEQATVAVAEAPPETLMEAFRSINDMPRQALILTEIPPPPTIGSDEVTYVLPLPDAATQPSAAPPRSK